MARPRNVEREERERGGRPEGPMFVTWTDGDGKGRAKAFEQAGHELDRADGLVRRTIGSDGVVNRHPGDRDGGRGTADRPLKPREVIHRCMRTYDEFSVVRNIMDTYSDFTVQGVGLTHPNPRIEKFYQEWFYKVSGPDTSEHIAHNLFLAANAPVRRHTARVSRKDEENFKKGVAAADPVPPPFLLGKREIPISYTVMNPVQMTVLGGDIVPFIGPNAFTYAVEVPATVVNAVKRPRNQVERDLVERLPPKVAQAIKDGMNVIPLSSDQMHCLYYKRRHWQVWATPMTYPLLDDLAMLKKLKLADMAALDGAISHIRVWKLGSLEHRMMPTKRAIEKLADMLANAGNGVSLDLIWGPDLVLDETKTEIQRFLGEAKYAPHLAAIYAGYGIPPTLVGAAVGGNGGMTNNFISLKTLTERLQYCRRIVREFWEYEAGLVQQAMGFRLPPAVRFDRMVLTDEAAEKALLIQLADRDLISVETIQERFGEDPLLEMVRQRREARHREKGRLPQKASAWHNPEKEHDKLKQFIQAGGLTPSEAGVDLQPKEPGQQAPLDKQAEEQAKQQKLQMKQQQDQNDHQYRTERLQLRHGVHPAQVGQPAPGAKPGRKPGADAPRRGQPQQGRPRNSKDTEKRQTKRVRVRTKAALVESLGWAEESLRAVAEATGPAYLAQCGKANFRQLTDAESGEFERFKFAVLANLPAGVEVGPSSLGEVLSKPLPVPGALSDLLSATDAAYRRANGGKAPPVERVREWAARVVAIRNAEVEAE